MLQKGNFYKKIIQEMWKINSSQAPFYFLTSN